MNKNESSINTISKMILSKVGEIGYITVDAFFPKKYPQARLWREILGLDRNYKFSKDKFSSILSKLKSEGLVKRIGSKKKSKWGVTSKGEFVLKKFKNDKLKPTPDGQPRIVVFDIPEKEKHKRVWIRSELVALGYKMVQKSVWLGKCPLPEDFMLEIKQRNLTYCVHIFSVKEKGTIEA